MNIGAWMCGGLVIPFATVGILFGIFKEKATKYVAGFFKESVYPQMMEQSFIWELLLEFIILT